VRATPPFFFPSSLFLLFFFPTDPPRARAISEERRKGSLPLLSFLPPLSFSFLFSSPTLSRRARLDIAARSLFFFPPSFPFPFFFLFFAEVSGGVYGRVFFFLPRESGQLTVPLPLFPSLPLFPFFFPAEGEAWGRLKFFFSSSLLFFRRTGK